LKKIKTIINGRKIVGGKAEGKALITKDNISFMGGVDPKTGIITERGHEIEGFCISDKILFFPSAKGSTGGSYMIYELAMNGKAPKAFINIRADPIIAIGAIIAKLPFIDNPDKNPFDFVKNGDSISVDADNGKILIYEPKNT
jgi:predicted aconitase with swiveling domain